MRRAGFLGHHPPRDKEHHLASRKTCFAFNVTCAFADYECCCLLPEA
jgi:hypothetical protein